MLKIAFIGAVELSRRFLGNLIDLRSDIVGVCTLRESPTNADHNDLSPICEAHEIPWIYAPDINSEATVRWIADKQPTVIFCFGWSRLLSEELLHLAPLGVIGFHPAALPANRGRHPLIWALALGLRETAATFFFMKVGVDDGDILSQETVSIEDRDDATALYEKVACSASGQIAKFLPQLASGVFPRKPQENGRANLWRKRGRADGQIDWRMSAKSIHNLVRALAKPYVGAHFLYKHQEIKIWKAEVVAGVPDNIEPGKILELTEDTCLVKCGEQGIRLLDTNPPFKAAIGEYL